MTRFFSTPPNTLMISVYSALFCVALGPLQTANGQDESAEEEDDEIVVTSARREIQRDKSPVAVDVITREDIESSGNENIVDMLEDQMGVVVVRSVLGSGIRLQGLDPKHTLILIDGERILGAKDGFVDLSRLPLESIERIEIIKGPQSALYGSDAMGGIINLITRKNTERLEADLRVRYGSRSQLDATAGLAIREGIFSNKFVAGWHSSAGYDLDPSDVSTNGAEIQQFDFFDKARLQLGVNHWVNARVSYMQRNSKNVNSNGVAIFDRTNLTEDFQTGLRWNWITDEKSMMTFDSAFSIYRDQYLSDQRDANDLDEYQETIEHLGAFHWQYDRQLTDNNALTIGVDAFVQDMTSSRLKGGTGIRQRGAIFAQDIWTFGNNEELTLYPGFRLDLDTWFGLNPTPKLAVRFAPVESLNIRASYGLGYRAPDFKEMFLFFENKGVGYQVEGNPDLLPENSFSYQLGIDYEFNEAVSMGVNGFRNDIQNLITTGTLDDGSQGGTIRFGYVNIGQARTQGIESQVQFKANDLFNLKLSYTFTDAQDLSATRRLEGQPIHQSTASVNGKHEEWGLGYVARAAFFGNRAFFEDLDRDGVEETTLAKPYLTVDLRTSLDIGDIGDIFLGVDNLLNVGDARYAPIPPTLVYGGFTGRFIKKKKPSTDKAPLDGEQ